MRKKNEFKERIRQMGLVVPSIYKKNFVIEASLRDEKFIITVEEIDNDCISHIDLKIVDKDGLEELENQGYINFGKSDFKFLIDETFYTSTEDLQNVLINVIGRKSMNNSGRIKLEKELDKFYETNRFSENIDYNNMNKIYYPDYIVFEREVLTLKIPTMVNEGTFPVWDYDYLIKPVTNMLMGDIEVEEKLIDKINIEREEENRSQILLNLSEFYNDSVLCNFTINRYRLKQYEYRIISCVVKLIVNIIRDREIESLGMSKYYDIYQHSRMAREDKLGYTKLEWRDSYSEEITYPQLLRDCLDKSKEEVIQMNLEEWETYIEKRNKLKMMSLSELLPKNEDLFRMVDYINSISIIDMHRKINQDEDEELFELYGFWEQCREYLRRDIFLLNLSLKGSMQDIVSFYISGTSMNLSNIEHLEFRALNNIVELKFKRKQSVISDGDIKYDWDKY